MIVFFSRASKSLVVAPETISLSGALKRGFKLGSGDVAEGRSLSNTLRVNTVGLFMALYKYKRRVYRGPWPINNLCHICTNIQIRPSDDFKSHCVY